MGPSTLMVETRMGLTPFGHRDRVMLYVRVNEIDPSNL